MKKGLLITLPQSDDVTEYLAVFSKPIIEECERKRIKFVEIKKENVTKEKVESLICSYDYKFIIFNGHGGINSITGHKNQELIKKGVNDKILCNRITYARSCWAAAGLGIACMQCNKEGCFIGYNIPFMFLIDITWATNPSKDKIAKIFFDTSNQVPISLIKGKTAEESNKNSKTAMLKAIKKSLLKGDNDSQSIAEILWNNYSGQTILGEKEATL